MKKLRDSEGRCKIDLDIKFSPNHPNKVLQPFWEFKKTELKDFEYYIQVFHDIDNVMFFQINTAKGHLTGILDPLNSKFKANFFKNVLQVDDKHMEKIKEMCFL